MITETVLQAVPRDEIGKNASRRLRAAGRIPVTLYGGEGNPLSVSIVARELGVILRSESGKNTIFTLEVDGDSYDMVALGERSITVDCDVLQADGGTRTASICGGYLALHDALSRLVAKGELAQVPLVDHLAAVSVGIVDGEARLDLPYAEDSRAEVDFNVVATGRGEIVEVQVEIWPTSMVFKRGHRLRLDVQPRDGVGSAAYMHYHADYNTGTNTIHAGGDKPSYLLLPVIPPDGS